ncbi:UPF0551 protein C8orf38 mitochondrial [Fasciola gigantica]|uniref:UPF0551 protein C8orf38 mitochondrial n=1 Tax=Fasciola gigantica TaxID=46835 RepID=A0A504YSI2_FASGI|nr:UPF0551 protein C8orf38 mitochondrial [Fasciola gigantica]
MTVGRFLPVNTVLKRSISHCLNIVKNYDRENYLCSLLLPEPQRSFALAIRAMNVELAQEKHFNECAFNSLKDAERYAEDTNVSLLYLICEAHGLKSVSVDHALSHLGQAQGLVNLLRGSVSLARRRRVVVLPLDLLNKHNLNQEMVLRVLRTDPTEEHPKDNTTTEALLNMYHDLASVAHQHASIAARLAREATSHFQNHENRSLADSTSESAFRRVLCRQMLPLVPISSYLDRLHTKANFDPRRLASHVDGLLPLRLSWQALRNQLPNGPST